MTNGGCNKQDDEEEDDEEGWRKWKEERKKEWQYSTSQGLLYVFASKPWPLDINIFIYS